MAQKGDLTLDELVVELTDRHGIALHRMAKTTGWTPKGTRLVDHAPETMAAISGFELYRKSSQP